MIIFFSLSCAVARHSLTAAGEAQRERESRFWGFIAARIFCGIFGVSVLRFARSVSRASSCILFLRLRRGTRCPAVITFGILKEPYTQSHTHREAIITTAVNNLFQFDYRLFNAEMDHSIMNSCL